MKKSQAEATTAKNLEEKFDRGEDVLDYFDLKKARVIDPRSKGSAAKEKVLSQLRRSSNRRAVACHAEAERRRVIREKSARYRKKK